MKFKSGLILGLGAGYVLGAKAGRERYQEIVEMWGQVTGSPKVQKVTERTREVASEQGQRTLRAVTETAQKVSEKAAPAVQQVTEKASTLVEKATPAVKQVTEKAGTVVEKATSAVKEKAGSGSGGTKGGAQDGEGSSKASKSSKGAGGEGGGGAATGDTDPWRGNEVPDTAEGQLP